MKRLQHVMIISNKMEMAETLQLSLSAEGFQVSVIHDGLRGLLAIKRVLPDLAIVSWAPPRLSGLELCHRLRSERHTSPIILLTEGDNARDRIAGLEAGASDCLSFPIEKEELIARIRANLVNRKQPENKNPHLKCVDIMLNLETREVFRGDRFIRLTAKEFDLLKYLMSNYFRVLTRAQILDNVWGYAYSGNSNIVEVYVRYLRNKLNNDNEPNLIQTIRSVGYILREPDGRDQSSK
ncbi:MAG: response regulator transcription factor [Phormidesmis sp.]